MPASPLHDDPPTVLPDVADSMGSVIVDSPLPHTVKVAILPVTIEDIESGKEPRGCQRCGETESQVYIVIDAKDYCRACAAIVRLEGFHYRVTGDQ